MKAVLTSLVAEVKALTEISEEVYQLTQRAFDKRVELTYLELASLLVTSVVPKHLHYIVIQVSLKRYQRKGHEGHKSYDQSEQRITFETANDFTMYQDVIQSYNRQLTEGSGYQWM